MKTSGTIGWIAGLLFSIFAMPALALASGSALVAGLSPGGTVGVGTQVTFTIVPSGFTNPSYWVVDSFGGGVNNTNIDGYGNISWTPNNSDIGTHTITVRVSDAAGDTASASQTIVVTTPSITIGQVSPSTTNTYGTPLTFTLSTVGFVSPQYSVADTFANSSITSSNLGSSGQFHWTPVFQDVGTHTLIATARDYVGHYATSSQHIVVTGPASMSIASIAPGPTVHTGEMLTFFATTTSFVQPALSIGDAFTSTLGTSSLTIDQTGKATWTPVYNDIGTHRITVTATDSSGNSATVPITVTVIPASQAMYTPATAASTAPTAAPASAAAPTAAAYVFKNFLSVGSSGKDVLALQQLLLQLGYFSGLGVSAPTGYFGAVTKRAVQSYQTAHGISPLGWVGPATRTALSTGK